MCNGALSGSYSSQEACFFSILALKKLEREYEQFVNF